MPPRPFQLLPRAVRERAPDYMLACAFVLLTAVLELAFKPFIAPAAYFPFVLPVVVSGWLGGLGPALLATGLALAMVEAFFLPAPESVLSGNAHDLLRIALFLAVGASVSGITHAMRRARAVAEAERARYARMAAIVASTDDAVVSHALDGTILSWNDAAERLYGWTRAQAIGRPVAMLAAGVHAAELSVVLDRLRRGAAVQGLESCHVRADGQPLDVAVTMSPVRDGSGAITGGSLIVRDIGARLQAEHALQESEQRYRFLAEALPQIVFITNADGSMAYCNPHWYRLTGLTESDMATAEGWTRVIHPDDLPRLRELNAHAGDDAAHEYEYRLRRASDGAWRWHLSRSIPQHDRDGRVTRRIGVGADIDDQKRVQELLQLQADALRSSEARFRSMADGLPLLVWTAEPDGTPTWHNARWREFVDPDRAADQPLTLDEMDALVHPDERNRMRAFRAGGLRTSVPYTFECRLRRRSGAWRWHRVRVAPQFDGRGRTTQWLGTLTDTDDQHRAVDIIRNRMSLLEARVQERTAELRASHDQMVAFTYTISHDLKSPLRSMRGYIDALLEDYADALGEDGRTWGVRIAESADRMNALIDDLLAWSRLGKHSVEPAPFPVRNAVAQALEQLEADLRERDAQLHVDVPEGLVAQGHETMFAQAVANLIANAIKFVRVGVTPQVQVSALATDEVVRVCVTDNGIGIAEEHHERIFGVFERLHPRETYPGTGVGLAMVRRAMEQMSGRAWVDSAPGTGSRFWLELRAAEPAAERAVAGDLAPSDAAPAVDDPAAAAAANGSESPAAAATHAATAPAHPG